MDDMSDVYRKPGRGRYREVTRFRRGQRMTIAVFPQFSFRVTDILG